MPAPEFLIHASAGWSRLYSDSKAISSAVTYVHLAGLLLGGGAAVAADIETLKTAGDTDPVRADHLAFLGSVHSIAITGLVLLAFSGALMLFADLDTFWSARSFWIKMCLVVLLLANGVLLTRTERLARTLPAKAWPRLKLIAITSLVLWFAIVLAGTILASS
jgi:hypothetical protein